MSEMTLADAMKRLHLFMASTRCDDENEHALDMAAWDVVHDFVCADANLTRAPVQVTDGEAKVAIQCIEDIRAHLNSLGRTHPSYLHACDKAKAALESARLAQPVVDVDERLRVILRERNHRVDGDTTTLLERVRHMSLGDRDCIAMNETWHKNSGTDTQPRPQAAQGSEMQGEASAWMTPESIRHLAKQNGVAHVPAWNVSGDGRVPVYTHPAERAAVPEDGLYYLQDSRSYVGNCPSWWAKGRAGYTTKLDEAHRFTFDEAMRQHRDRSTDIPWSCSEVDSLARRTVDMQHMRSIKEQCALLSAAPTLAGKEGAA